MPDYGTVLAVKRKLNLNTASTEVDDHIDDYLEESDEYINTRVTLMNGTAPIVGDEELDALGSSLAASLYNYWTSPSKSLTGVEHFKKAVVDHLKAKFASKMEQDVTQNTYSKTASRTLGTS